LLVIFQHVHLLTSHLFVFGVNVLLLKFSASAVKIKQSLQVECLRMKTYITCISIVSSDVLQKSLASKFLVFMESTTKYYRCLIFW